VFFEFLRIMGKINQKMLWQEYMKKALEVFCIASKTIK
jgi:hypothetical protein